MKIYKEQHFPVLLFRSWKRENGELKQGHYPCSESHALSPSHTHIPSSTFWLVRMPATVLSALHPLCAPFSLSLSLSPFPSLSSCCLSTQLNSEWVQPDTCCLTVQHFSLSISFSHCMSLSHSHSLYSIISHLRDNQWTIGKATEDRAERKTADLADSKTTPRTFTTRTTVGHRLWYKSQ